MLRLVPQGGDWRDLPEDIAKEYMGGSWLLGGGKTGMARRLSLDEPSLTLTCSPCQKQTERCHPIETRPLTVREYARVQTFPDNWLFAGTMSDKYKQIGNAVPVNLAWAIGRSLIRLFNEIQKIEPSTTVNCMEAVSNIVYNVETRCLEEMKKDVIDQIKKEDKKIGQLNFYDLLDTYPCGIVPDMVREDLADGYGAASTIDYQQRVLVCLVKKDNIKPFLDRTANIYYTGKRFPSTVELKKIHYFIPYLSGIGIRDLYRVKLVRVGLRNDGQEENTPKDYRLVFEIEFVKQLYDGYVKKELEIWHTFTDTILKDIMDD